MSTTKTGNPEPIAAAVAGYFALHSPIRSVERYGDGLINDTYLTICGGSRYLLQRINRQVFPDPRRIMSNLSVLTKHLENRAGGGLRIPTLIASRDGLPYVLDEDGGIWRLMAFIPDARVLRRIDDPEQARETGRILGRFHMLTRDLAPDSMSVTLPGFHVTPVYLERLRRVVDARSPRLTDEIRNAVMRATGRKVGVSALEDALREGRIPVRVIHGDPKLDNILFDCTTGRAVSLIDLDTVQPGLVHHDLGDCLRSCCNRGGESGGGGSEVVFDLALCREILTAYAEQTREVLGAAEIELIFDAIRLIPFELGVRFLTDHLEGDRYFRVTQRGQNLRKALIQLSLVDDIERNEPEIRKMVAQCF
jgi:Ser/Thr protein kinase RdoA (MazF antagonist)